MQLDIENKDLVEAALALQEFAKQNNFGWGPDGKNTYFVSVLAAILAKNGIILDVGCGDQKIAPKVLGVDAFYETDVKAYMWDMPFADNSVDAIVTFHSLEHVSKYQILPTLNEFSRVLKYDSPLVIVVPDLTYVMTQFLQETNINELMNWRLDTLFGNQHHEGQYHKTGFTRQIMEKYFSAVSELEIVEFLTVLGYNQENIGVLAKKVGDPNSVKIA
jgi:predicted SAM-dependent methyltransferase